MREHHRKQKLASNFIWGGIGAIVLLGIGFFVWQNMRPGVGAAVPEMPATHVALDTDPGTYNSNPPTSGKHYPQTITAGFYDTNNYTFPAGYLLHNLEHGYVVIWYNCDKLSESACSDLKTQIKSVMDELGNNKLIAYPWPSLEVPVAMTTWGRVQKFQTFDADQIKAFYRANLNRAPEPDAP